MKALELIDRLDKHLLMNNDRAAISSAQAELRRLAEVNAELLGALIPAYYKMADVFNQWPGRDSMEGQALLCKMRDSIAMSTGMDAEAVQNGEAKAQQ